MGAGIARFLPNNQYQAALSANAPTALNPFATIADLAGLGGGETLAQTLAIGNIMEGDIIADASAGIRNIITDNAATANKYARVQFGAADVDNDYIWIVAGDGTKVNTGGYFYTDQDVCEMNYSAGDAAILMDATGVSINSASPATSVSINNTARFYEDDKFELGLNASSFDDSSVSIGKNSIASAIRTTSFGESASATAQAAVAFGWSSLSSGIGSVAIGQNPTATANGDIAIGVNALASGQNGAPRSAIAIGKNSVCDNYESTVIGEEAGFGYLGTFGVQAVLIGHRAGRNNNIGNGAVGVGNSTIVRQNRGVAIGSVAESDGIGAIALGGYTKATADRAIMIGKGFAAAAKMTNNVSDSFGIGWSTSSGDTTPDVLIAKTADSYFNIDGNMIIGGTAPANSKLEVNGDIETLGNTNGMIQLDRSDGNRYRIYIENGILYTELA